MSQNHRVRETCMVCEGTGKAASLSSVPSTPAAISAQAPVEDGCAYCQGSGYVFSRLEGPGQVLMATGDCKVPAKLRPLQGVQVVRNFT